MARATASEHLDATSTHAFPGEASLACHAMIGLFSV